MLKYRFIFALFILPLVFSGCRTTVLSLSNTETYSLERVGDSSWRIHRDSEYYGYFNKIQQTYQLLLKNAKDPGEMRRLFIERDLKIAEKRLAHLADPKLVKETVGATAGREGANPTGHLFRMIDVDHVPRQDFTPSNPQAFVFKSRTTADAEYTDAMTAIVQFDRQLKARGVSLIVVPVPNSVQVYTHLLNPDIHLEDEVWHPWAHMIAKLLQNDVEVLDLIDLFKAYSGDNTVLNYMDHHWGQAGMEIVSREIAQRLKRFTFEPRYLCDPGQFKITPITISTPAMIPYWDHLSIPNLAARMPYKPRYDTVSITYQGQTIVPASNFEASPVLLMGDSFIPHAADTSSGIYAHLAYYTKIIPAAFSHDAGAADPPRWYARDVAGKGKEPKVVIWEIYGSAFEEESNLNSWKVVNMPAPAVAIADTSKRPNAGEQRPNQGSGLSLQPERKMEWISGEVIRVSEIPAIKKFTYPDALYAYQMRVTDTLSSRLNAGQTIVVYSRFLENFKVKPDKILKKGDKACFYLEEWSAASKNTEKIGTMQLVDDLEDYKSDIYFEHFREASLSDRLSKLETAFLEKNAAAKDANPRQSLTFKLKDTHLLESMKIALRPEKTGPVEFSIETSLDGKSWFSLYTCRIAGSGEAQIVTLDAAHPALYVRFSGPAVEKEIAFDKSRNGRDDFSGIEIFGY